MVSKHGCNPDINISCARPSCGLKSRVSTGKYQLWQNSSIKTENVTSQELGVRALLITWVNYLGRSSFVNCITNLKNFFWAFQNILLITLRLLIIIFNSLVYFDFFSALYLLTRILLMNHIPIKNTTRTSDRPLVGFVLVNQRCITTVEQRRTWDPYMKSA